MITAHHLVFGRKYQGLFKIPFGICNRYRFEISTRSGNLVIKMPDGEIINYNTPKLSDLTLVNNTTHIQRNYATPFPAQDVDVVTNNGNNDVYSFLFNWADAQYNDNYNIQNLGDFWAQFPNLFSIHYNIYAYGINDRRPTIKGNLFAFPKSVTRVRISNLDVLNRPNDTFGNFDSFTNDMQLIYFNDGETVVSGGSKYYGNLAKTPPNVNFLKITATNNSTLTYTSGKVWASSFDTLDIGNAMLSATETDNLFNDMANSITTAIGSKIIRLANCYRTSASNSAVANLQSLGFTITVLGIGAKILDLPFQNNFTDTTGINTMIAGGTSNLPTFTLEGGEYAATFNGSQSLKTNANFNINSDKVSISLWLKTSQTALGNILELSNNFNNNNAFSSFINDLGANKIAIYDHNSAGNNYGTSTVNINDNTWKHIVLMIDRSKGGSQQNSIYVNGVLSYVQNTTNQTDLNGNFGLFPLFIGQRAGNSLGLNGQMKFLKIYNYHISQTEITNLLNKTM